MSVTLLGRDGRRPFASKPLLTILESVARKLELQVKPAFCATWSPLSSLSPIASSTHFSLNVGALIVAVSRDMSVTTEISRIAASRSCRKLTFDRLKKILPDLFSCNVVLNSHPDPRLPAHCRSQRRPKT